MRPGSNVMPMPPDGTWNSYRPVPASPVGFEPPHLGPSLGTLAACITPLSVVWRGTTGAAESTDRGTGQGTLRVRRVSPSASLKPGHSIQNSVEVGIITGGGIRMDLDATVRARLEAATKGQDIAAEDKGS